MCIIHLHSFTVYSFITRFIVPPRRKYFTTLYFPQLRSFLGRNMCIARACVRKTCVQVPTRSSNASATHENNQSIDHSGRNQTSLVGGWTNPFEKYGRQNGSSPKLGWKIKNIGNHYISRSLFLSQNQPTNFHLPSFSPRGQRHGPHRLWIPTTSAACSPKNIITPKINHMGQSD